MVIRYLRISSSKHHMTRNMKRNPLAFPNIAHIFNDMVRHNTIFRNRKTNVVMPWVYYRKFMWKYECPLDSSTWFTYLNRIMYTKVIVGVFFYILLNQKVWFQSISIVDNDINHWPKRINGASRLLVYVCLLNMQEWSVLYRVLSGRVKEIF